MSRARFGAQAAFVLALIVLVSWPERPQTRSASVWRTGAVAGTRGGLVLPDGIRGRRVEIGYGSARLDRASAALGSQLERKLYGNDVEGGRRYATPPAVLALGGQINAILGRATTTLNAAVPFARLVLRNLATGEVEARATADENGAFTFLDVMPSGYVVELVGADGAVLATSEFVPIALGDVKETMVRVSGAQPVLAMFGPLAGTANESLDAAAGSGVNRVTAPDATISPQR
jgi:hypothetical protein